MELTQLLQFKAIAELGNISRAAESLHISQPALSQALVKLEEELGVKLFDRTKNRIKLNSAGKIALEHINNIVAEIDTMKSLLIKHATLKNQILNISSEEDPSLRYFITEILKCCSDITILTSLKKYRELEKCILNKSVDISFTSEPMQNPNIYSTFIYEDFLMISVPETHEFFDRSTLSINDFNSQRFLKPAGESLLFKKIDDITKKENITFDAVIQKDFALYKEMSKTTKLLVFTSTMTIKHARSNNHRRNILVTNPNITVKYYASCHKDNGKRFIPFIDAIRNSYLNDIVK